MPAIVVPPGLPMPAVATLTPTERRLLSSLAGPRQARVQQRDFNGTQRIEWAVLSRAQMSLLSTWWREDLLEGGAWFAATWPLPEGLVVGVRKFLAEPAKTYLGADKWRASALCEVRGRGELPQSPGSDSPAVVISVTEGEGSPPELGDVLQGAAVSADGNVITFNGPGLLLFGHWEYDGVGYPAADFRFTLDQFPPGFRLWVGLGGTDNDFYPPIDVETPPPPAHVSYSVTASEGEVVGNGAYTDLSIPVVEGDIVRVTQESGGAVTLRVNGVVVGSGGPLGSLERAGVYVGITAA